MQFWHFSETPYPALPPSEEYDSVRVTLPNALMDPDLTADLWQRYLEDWVEADREGLNILVNEHHGTATCLDPVAPVVAGALSQITKNARICILGNPIANRKDPVRVAEEMAMLDILTGGRLEVGFVRGVPYEVSATNSSPWRSNDRMWEAIELIQKAWNTHDGPFNWEGEFFHHRQVNIWPRPYTRPNPPIWVTGMSAASAPRIAKHDYTLATFLTGVEGTKKIFGSYREAWNQHHEGHPDPSRLAYSALVYVGDTDAEGLAGAEELMWYIRENKVPSQFVSPPGYTPYHVRAGQLQGESSVFNLASMSLEQLVENGTIFAGSPETVVEQITAFHDKVGGFGHLLLHSQAGPMSPEITRKGIRNFARRVKPALETLLSQERVAAISA